MNAPQLDSWHRGLQAKVKELHAENDALRSRLAEVNQANERFAIRVLGQEAYDNSPCQAHPLELVEVEIESLRSRLAEVEAERDIRLAQVETHVQANVRLEARLAEAEAALLRLADAASAIDVDRATKEWNVEEFDFAILQAREALRVTDSASGDPHDFRYLCVYCCDTGCKYCHLCNLPSCKICNPTASESGER